MSAFVIGDKDTILGMQIVGVSGKTVHDTDEAAEALESALDDETIVILFVTRQWAESMRDRINRLKMNRLRPIVLEIPGRELNPPEESMSELVRKAIGISI